MHFKLLAAALIVTLNLVLTPSSLQADSLKADAAAAGLDWIIGQWGDKATNGAAVKLSYQWRLDGHAVSVTLAAPDRKSEGMIARNAKTQKIGYISVDNQGGGASGTVEPDAGNIVFKVTYSDGGTGEGKMAITHEQRGAETMKLIISDLSESGEVLGTKMELELVKMKETPATGATGQ